VELCPKHSQVDALVEALWKYQAAAGKFIAKVESGRARSVETYSDLKICFDMASTRLAAVRAIGGSNE